MAALSDRHRRFIVTELACFASPSEAAKAVKETFGIEVSRQQVWHYDATRSGGAKDLADRWKRLFEEVRKRWLEGLDDVAIAHRRYRLEQLDQLFRDRKAKNDVPTAAALLEQAAKEVGDAFTNKKRFVDKDDEDRELGVYVVGPGSSPPADFVDPTAAPPPEDPEA